MPLQQLLNDKIQDSGYRQTIISYAARFSPAEQQLLHEILNRFTFDPMQAQALVQAVIQQSRFDPNAAHISGDDDDESTAICAHCLNPPVPPLRDYHMWRTR